MINVSINRKSVLGAPAPSPNSMSSANYKDVAFLLRWGWGAPGSMQPPSVSTAYCKRFSQASYAPLEGYSPRKNKTLYLNERAQS